ncbi:MAG: DUF4159 domain-containing protein, partial [Bryobacteraceae bacterium]
GALFITLLCAQKPFRVYPSMEGYDDIPVPADYQMPSEFVFARLMYPQHPEARFGGGRRWGFTNWREGGTSWTQDYPRADRHFLTAVRRLTRIDARSVEQPVNLDDGDDVYNWPMLYAVRPGEWNLTDAQAEKMRDYLARGGFFWCDDFWGDYEWQVFMQSMSRVLPGKQPVDIDNQDAIFHVLYDLDDRVQVPGSWGTTGDPPAWRAIYDDKGRIVAAITPGSDLGDAWEFADNPRYPEKYATMAIHIGINYTIYALTH